MTEEAGFEEMLVYVTKRQNTVTQYITTQPILDLCKKTARRLGAWVASIWWEQEGLDLAGEMEATALTSYGEGGSEEEEK